MTKKHGRPHVDSLCGCTVCLRYEKSIANEDRLTDCGCPDCEETELRRLRNDFKSWEFDYEGVSQ